jgi:ubiquinone/menaquinone biosynthesis C-methylase UbiE
MVHEGNADQAAYWNGEAGRRWTDRQETQDRMLAPVTELLLARARVAAGESVIDVGCGCGATAIALAEQVGARGHVLGLDISAPMLERARQRATPGLPVTFALADATVHAFPPARADLLFSRFGVMFFADPVLAFANMRKGLAPGARVVLACWKEPRENPWMIVPLQAAYRHVPRLPELGPEDPGPFAFASAQRVTRILTAAGFAAIAIESCPVVLDLAVGQGLEAAVSTALAIGPVSRALADRPEATGAVAAAVREALAAVQKGDAVPLGACVGIITASC